MDSTQYSTDFPCLGTIDLHTYFQEQIVYFFFNLTKKDKQIHEKGGIMDDLSKQLVQVLQLLKKQIHIKQQNEKNDSGLHINVGNDWVPYLELFYRMIGQTRDIFSGKGEHELSYMLILSFYEVFPTLAIYALHRFVLPLAEEYDNSFDMRRTSPELSRSPSLTLRFAPNIVYGSWRDMKYLCDYVRTHSSRGENHELIHICVHLMNTQLKKDIEMWKFSIRARSREHISNVAKWIPREHKQFDWLYDRLVVHWANTYIPYVLKTATNNDGSLSSSYDRAFSKCKRIYRKTVAFMNKALDTTEIKLCSQVLNEIRPKNVSTYTMMKQRKMVFGNISGELHQQFKNHFDKLFNGTSNNCMNGKNKLLRLPTGTTEFITAGSSPTTSSCGNPARSKSMHTGSLFFTVSYFIKEAIRLFKLKQLDGDVGNDLIDYEIDVLNNQWFRFSQSFKNNKLENTIPLLDVSFSIQENDEESYYNAIGIAILIAERSSFGKRVLAIDHQPTWIILENTSFISNVENIIQTTKSMQNTAFNIKNSIDYLMFSMKQINIPQSFVDKMSIVILTDFTNLSYNHLVSSFGPTFSARIVFWNLSKRCNIELPCSVHNNKVIMLSGFSNCLHSYLSSLAYFNNREQPDTSQNITPYHFISHILENPRYHLLSDYLYKIVNKY